MASPTAADGHQLFVAALTGPNSTGYKNVYLKAAFKKTALPYIAEDDNRRSLGRFSTAIAAAVAYAKYRAGERNDSKGQVKRILEDNGKNG
jgi:hypothetical protein